MILIHFCLNLSNCNLSILIFIRFMQIIPHFYMRFRIIQLKQRSLSSSRLKLVIEIALKQKCKWLTSYQWSRSAFLYIYLKLLDSNIARLRVEYKAEQILSHQFYTNISKRWRPHSHPASFLYVCNVGIWKFNLALGIIISVDNFRFTTKIHFPK